MSRILIDRQLTIDLLIHLVVVAIPQELMPPQDEHLNIALLEAPIPKVRCETHVHQDGAQYAFLLGFNSKINELRSIFVQRNENKETTERFFKQKYSKVAIFRVRTSHERERERVEKTKWWSVSASLLGALLGIAGASIGTLSSNFRG